MMGQSQCAQTQTGQTTGEVADTLPDIIFSVVCLKRHNGLIRVVFVFVYLNNFDAAARTPTVAANNENTVVDQARARLGLTHAQLCDHCPLVKVGTVDFCLHHVNSLIDA